MARPSRAGRTSLNRHRHVAGRRPSRLRGLESERRGSGIAPANFLEWVTTVAGATTLVGALLYYFGWARASTTFSYFGIEAEVLGLSFQDYLLRSVRSTYQPLLVVAVLGLGAVALRRFLLKSSAAFTVGVALATLGSVSVLFGLLVTLTLVTVRADWPLVPAVYLIGTVLIIYGAGMVAADKSRAPGTVALVSGHPLAAGVVILLAFWVVSTFASSRGTAVAEQISADLERRPSVVVLSEKDLRLRGSGMKFDEIDDADSAFAFCYSGLRLLIRSGGRQFLLPEHWKRGRDPVIVLDENDSLRFEYFRSTVAIDCR